MGIGSNIGKALLAQAPDMAPGAAVSMLRSILGFAIDGASSLPGARQAAGKTLTKHDGDVEQAISSLVNQHIAMAGAQGFVSNLGGVVTLAVTIPANISGVAIVQARMVAAIAHLRGLRARLTPEEAASLEKWPVLQPTSSTRAGRACCRKRSTKSLLALKACWS